MLKLPSNLPQRLLLATSRAGDHEFLPEALQLVRAPPSPLRLTLGLTVCALFAAALAWSWFGHVDEYAEASGRIEPAGRSKVIQPFEAGRVAAIHVANGSRVRRGAPLVDLDPTEPSANQAAAASALEGLDAEIARRNAELAYARRGMVGALPPIAFPANVGPVVRRREEEVLAADLEGLAASARLLKARIAQSRAQYASLGEVVANSQRVIETTDQRYEMRRQLADDGWDSKANVFDAEEELRKAQVSLATEQSQRASAGAEALGLQRQLEQTVAKFVADDAGAIEAASAKRNQAQQEVIKASAAANRTHLTAPVDGVVQELDITTIGQVVTTGEQMMTIVPDRSPLEVDALVQNSDIGFVRVGDPVVVKVQTFPFTKYGVLNGHVTEIAPEAVDYREAVASQGTQRQPVAAKSSAASPSPNVQNLVFPVRIRLDKATMEVDGRTVSLAAGMLVTAEIKSGRRRLLEYVLSPLMEVGKNAGHER